MNRLLKKLSSTLGIVMMLTVISSAFPFAAEAEEQSFVIEDNIYEFDKKSEYEIDSTDPFEIKDQNMDLGDLTISGDIINSYDKDGITAYEIADGKTFTLDFTYITTLKDAVKDEWHLVKDGKSVVNGSKLEADIDLGAIILQTSYDGDKWYDNKSYPNITDNQKFGEGQINNVQLSKGCYYRVIVAYEVERRTKDNKLFDEYDTKKIAQVYTFYASYKTNDTADAALIGEKYYFYAGAKNSAYTVKTKKNNYAGSETIDSKDPHYGWDLGCFCLSGYTDKGDADDVYLKKVGDKVKLTFRLDQDINSLNGKNNLIIQSDKNGSDEEFKVEKHDMKHGELIIRHIDSENKPTETKYSDFLAALASPGADTTVQLFEEGDYEVHLDYAITNTDGLIDSTTYYKTSFTFKIRNANCMVYVFDAESGAELSNGDVTANGFRIDTAKSSYPKLQVKKEILNNTESGLIEDTRFNGAASDGEIFTDEGIYTVKAYNRYDEKLEPAVKKIYVGSNNILTAYTRHLDSPEPYTIADLNNMIEDGYTITEDGNIIAPVIETTAITTVIDPQSEIETPKHEEKTTIAVTEQPEGSEQPVDNEQPDNPNTEVTVRNEKGNNTIILIICGVIAGIVLGVLGVVAFRKKKK